MIRFILGRLVGTIPTLVVVSVAMFLLLHLAPGDPAQTLLGDDATPQAVAAMRAELGLDQPLPVQYADWLIAAARGDFGRSLRSHDLVVHEILSRLPVTFELAAFALAVAVGTGIPLGILAAYRRNSWLDVGATGFALVGISLPSFFIGIVLILIFALWLRLVPPTGFVGFGESPFANLRSMILPSITLGVAFAGILARMMRSSLLEVLGDDYIRTARAKGATERAVLLQHALRNALLPVVTILGLEMGALLGGAILTESIFALPGVGRLVVESVFARDFPVVLGTVLFLALVRIGTNLLADVAYGALDPRIAYA